MASKTLPSNIDIETVQIRFNNFHDYLLTTLKDFYIANNNLGFCNGGGYATVFSSLGPDIVLKPGEMLGNDYNCFFDIVNNNNKNAIVVFAGRQIERVDVFFYKNYNRKEIKVDKKKLEFVFMCNIITSYIPTPAIMQMFYDYLENNDITVENPTPFKNLN